MTQRVIINIVIPAIGIGVDRNQTTVGRILMLIDIIVVVRTTILIKRKVPINNGFAPVAGDIDNGRCLIQECGIPLGESPFTARAFRKPNVLCRILFMDYRHDLFVTLIPVPCGAIGRGQCTCVLIIFEGIRSVFVVGRSIAMIPADNFGVETVAIKRRAKIICDQILRFGMRHGQCRPVITCVIRLVIRSYGIDVDAARRVFLNEFGDIVGIRLIFVCPQCTLLILIHSKDRTVFLHPARRTPARRHNRDSTRLNCQRVLYGRHDFDEFMGKVPVGQTVILLVGRKIVRRDAVVGSTNRLPQHTQADARFFVKQCLHSSCFRRIVQISLIEMRRRFCNGSTEAVDRLVGVILVDNNQVVSRCTVSRAEMDRSLLFKPLLHSTIGRIDL